MTRLQRLDWPDNGTPDLPPAFSLSEAEARLYKEVTDYVRQEFNRAEALQNDKRAGTVGFALTVLQRRLASSPEAIYQSLRRRRERLEKRWRELDLLQRSGAPPAPARFSTTNDCPDNSLIFWQRMRERESVAPPAGKPLT